MSRKKYYQPYYQRYSKKRRGSEVSLILLAAAPLALLLYAYKPYQSPSFIYGTVFFASCIAVLIGGLLWWRHSQKIQRQKALKLADIDTMNGIAFEHYVADLLRSQGYSQVRVTPNTNDFGADILFSDGEITYAAQVKRYRGFVGVDALYQASGGRDYYKCQKAAVITNSRFSTQALELAAKTGMLLIDRKTLTDWIVAFQQK